MGLRPEKRLVSGSPDHSLIHKEVLGDPFQPSSQERGHGEAQFMGTVGELACPVGMKSRYGNSCGC